MAQLASTLPANEARANFYQILEEAGNSLRRFTITHRGKTKVVIMSAEELESWEETLDILSNKETMKDLKQSARDIKAGRTVPLEKVLKELRINEA